MNLRLRRLRLLHLRLILALAVDLLTLAESLSNFGWLRPWLLPNRRSPLRYHLINDARQAWWPFNPPSRTRTPQVIAASIFGMTLVLLTSLVTASQGHFHSLLYIPGYGLFLIAILTLRAWRLSQVSS